MTIPAELILILMRGVGQKVFRVISCLFFCGGGGVDRAAAMFSDGSFLRVKE